MNRSQDTTGFWRRWLEIGLILLMVASLLPVLAPDVARGAFGLLVYADADRLATFAAEPMRYASFLHGVLGAVMFGWAVSLFLLVRGASPDGRGGGWQAAAASLVAWFVPGTLFSIASGVWLNVALNLLFLAAFGLPLVPLVRRARRVDRS
jgi:hypothetical protein